MYTLSEHFQDPDNDMLTYEAMSSNSSVASVTEPDAYGMFTLTAEGVSGDTSANITVKASDPYGASAQQTFTVGVGSNPPMTNSASTDVDLVLEEGMNSRALDLDDYFEDDFDTVLMYVLVSNDGEMYATAALDALDSSMLTITAVAAGSAKVTVSAQDSDNDPVRLTFNVMVTAASVTPTPNLAPTSTTIGAMSLMDGETDDLDLSMYFTDPEGDSLSYTAMSDNDGIATASMPNGVDDHDYRGLCRQSDDHGHRRRRHQRCGVGDVLRDGHRGTEHGAPVQGREGTR